MRCGGIACTFRARVRVYRNEAAEGNAKSEDHVLRKPTGNPIKSGEWLSAYPRFSAFAMSPLFACFPVCMTFVSLGLVGVIMYFAGAGRTELAPPTSNEPQHRPPYWIAPVVLLAATIILLLLSLVTDG